MMRIGSRFYGELLLRNFSRKYGWIGIIGTNRKGYLTDLPIFARWFEQTNGEELSLLSLTPTDIRITEMVL